MGSDHRYWQVGIVLLNVRDQIQPITVGQPQIGNAEAERLTFEQGACLAQVFCRQASYA